MVDELSLGQAAAIWLRVEESRCRPKTVKNLQDMLKLFLPGREDMGLSEFTTEYLAGWLAERGRVCAPGSIQLYIWELKWFWNFCVRQGWLEASPMRGIKTPKVPRKPIRVLEPDEEARLLAAAKPNLRALLIVALETGLRLGTLQALEWTWVDLAAGWLHIPASAMKSGRPLDIPLSWRALQALATLRPRTAFVFKPDPIGQLRKVRHIAGVRHFSFHDLRRTFLTRARRRGVPLEVAMVLSDHHDIQVVLRCYRQIDKPDLLKAVGR